MHRLYTTTMPARGTRSTINRLRATIRDLRDSRRAVTSIEYVIIASLIALVIVGSVTAVGNKLPASFNTVASEL